MRLRGPKATGIAVILADPLYVSAGPAYEKRPMSSAAPRDPLWPVWLWSAQLPIAALATGLLLARIAASGGRVSTILVGFALLSALWLTSVITVLAVDPGRRWIVRRRFEWVLVGLSTLIALLALDLVLTWLKVVPTIEAVRERSVEYTMGRFISYRLVPKQVLMDDGSTLSINRRGFRGAEFAPVKAPDQTRVIFLGGSQVFDFDGFDWPAASGVELRRRGHPVEVINAAVAGYNSTDSVAALLTDLWVLEPDLVVLCHGWNDVKYFSRIAPGSPYRGLPPLEPNWWEGDWRLHPRGLDRLLTVSALYRSVRTGIIRTLFTEEGRYTWAELGMPTTHEKEVTAWGVAQFGLNLELAAVLVERIGGRLVLCKQARIAGGAVPGGIDAADYAERNLHLPPAEIDKAFASVYSEVDAIAARRELNVIDMRGLAQEPDNFIDAVHFSERGSRQASLLVADALEGLLDN